MRRTFLRRHLFLLPALFLAGCASAPELSPLEDSPYRPLDSLDEGTILHVPTGQEVSRDALLDLLADKRIVYVGETHTNLAHHKAQLDILKGLAARRPGGIALGMEMFTRDAQPLLDRWTAGELDERAFEKAWYENWSTDYDYYRELLTFARDHQIPVLGLNASDELVMAFGMKGLSGLPDELRRKVPEMDMGDPYHRRAVEAVYHGHAPTGPSGKRAFERFYQTMLLWDETMAQSVSEYLSGPAGEDKTLMVVAGGFHVAYGFGIPKRAFRRRPAGYAVVLPYTDRVPKSLRMDVVPPQLPLYIADFVWKVPFEDLGARVQLGVQIEKAENGVGVMRVAPDSPAQQAGLRAEDVIVAFDGEKVAEPFDLIYLIRQKNWGDTAGLQYLRDDEPHEARVTFHPPESPGD